MAQLPQIQTPGPATRGPRSLQPQKDSPPVPLALPNGGGGGWTGAIHSSTLSLMRAAHAEVAQDAAGG